MRSWTWLPSYHRLIIFGNTPHLGVSMSSLISHFGNDLWGSPYVKIPHFCLITYHGRCWPYYNKGMNSRNDDNRN